MALQWACEPFATVDEVLAAGCACQFDDLVDPVQTWIDAATDILYHLAGGRVTGRCVRTHVRPIATDTATCYTPGRDPIGYSWGYPYRYTYRVDQIAVLNPVTLRVGSTVDAVRVDGTVLDPSAYAVIDDRYLIRRDGKLWPTRNDLTKADTEEGTWSIDLTFGSAPDLITRQATVEMVCELARADGIGNRVGFGMGVVAANVQGVALAINNEINEGRENLPYITRFLGIYAPGDQGRVSTGVYSPELDTPYRLVEVHYS